MVCLWHFLTLDTSDLTKYGFEVYSSSKSLEAMYGESLNAMIEFAVSTHGEINREKICAVYGRLQNEKNQVSYVEFKLHCAEFISLLYPILQAHVSYIVDDIASINRVSSCNCEVHS